MPSAGLGFQWLRGHRLYRDLVDTVFKGRHKGVTRLCVLLMKALEPLYKV